MGTTARRDIKIVKGDDFTLLFRLKYMDAGAFLPLDLTGSVIAIKMDFPEGTELTYSTTGSELAITDAANGEVTLTLSETATDALPAAKYRGRWSLKRTIDGKTTKHIAGNVILIDWTAT